MNIYSAREKLVNYEMELSLEDVLLFEQQCIEGSNVEDPAFSQWVFLKSHLDNYEYLFYQRKPVEVPVQLKLKDLEGMLPPNIKEKFEKRLSEGFDLDTDPLYNNWKHLKTGSSLSENSVQFSPKQSRIPLAPKQVNIPVMPKRVDVSPVFTSVLNPLLSHPEVNLLIVL